MAWNATPLAMVRANNKLSPLMYEAESEIHSWAMLVKDGYSHGCQDPTPHPYPAQLHYYLLS